MGKGGSEATGFANIPLHPATAEDLMEVKRAALDGPDNSAGTSRFDAN